MSRQDIQGRIIFRQGQLQTRSPLGKDTSCMLLHQGRWPESVTCICARMPSRRAMLARFCRRGLSAGAERGGRVARVVLGAFLRLAARLSSGLSRDLSHHRAQGKDGLRLESAIDGVVAGRQTLNHSKCGALHAVVECVLHTGFRNTLASIIGLIVGFHHPTGGTAHALQRMLHTPYRGAHAGSGKDGLPHGRQQSRPRLLHPAIQSRHTFPSYKLGIQSGHHEVSGRGPPSPRRRSDSLHRQKRQRPLMLRSRCRFWRQIFQRIQPLRLALRLLRLALKRRHVIDDQHRIQLFFGEVIFQPA